MIFYLFLWYNRNVIFTEKRFIIGRTTYTYLSKLYSISNFKFYELLSFCCR